MWSNKPDVIAGQKQYNRRDIEGDKLRQYYMVHLEAMTAENLHSKSDIAAELAYRDKIIEELMLSLFP